MFYRVDWHWLGKKDTFSQSFEILDWLNQLPISVDGKRPYKIDYDNGAAMWHIYFDKSTDAVAFRLRFQL